MKYLFSIILALLSMNAAAADTGDLTFIDWERLPIDSVLPLYTEVVPLETDYRSNTYTVSVEFPEWKPVNAREREVLDLRFASEIADTLEIGATVGVSRRQGMLDIAFVPIVRTGKTYQKLISGKIVITAHPKAKAKKPSVKKASPKAEAEKKPQVKKTPAKTAKASPAKKADPAAKKSEAKTAKKSSADTENKKA